MSTCHGARALGFAVLTAPNALFLHAVTNRPHLERLRSMMLTSAVLLGRKWGNVDFEARASSELAAAGLAVPQTMPDPVPELWRGIADFSRQFSFSPVRW